MKKILFAANTLTMGGIENALVSLINYLESQKKYDITLVLEKKEGILSKRLSTNIKIIEYSPSNCKNIFIRKIKNFIKRARFIVKYKNRFDFSASFATYSLPASFVARTASKNSALWVHNNYLMYYKNNISNYVDFFNSISCRKFKKIVFVSNEAKQDYSTLFKTNENLIVCNNLINSEEIISKSEEKIPVEKGKETVFVNIGRLEEHQKKLSRLLKASEMLNKSNYKFRLLIVGSGPDEEKYKAMIKELKLESCVQMCGMQKNPYPYYKMSDCVILTSEYEGYPVVFLEAMTLGKPIITTKVSDSMHYIYNKNGFVCEKNPQDVYEKMKLFIDKGFKMRDQFNPKQYNNKIITIIEGLIEGEK